MLSSLILFKNRIFVAVLISFIIAPFYKNVFSDDDPVKNHDSSQIFYEPVVFDKGQGALYKEIVNNLLSRHYKKQVLNDSLSKDHLARYIEFLDPGKNYFLKEDVTSFQIWSTKLDDFAKIGEIQPGFFIFNIFKKRYIDRLTYNLSLLKDEAHVFDFNTNQTISFDIDSRDWFPSKKASDEFWENRLTDLMIRQFLNDEEKKTIEARETLIKRYENQIRLITQRDSRDVFQLYVNAFASLFDPHTSYFSPRTNENFQINMSLSLEGIGAELTIEDEYTKVNRVVPGGPADLQGDLKAEDRIVGVGQQNDDIVDVIGWRLDEVVDLIRGAKNTIVRLEYIPSSSEQTNTKTISIVRDTVKLEDRATQSQIININNTSGNFDIGIIEIPAFYMDFEGYRARDPNYRSTSKDVFKIVNEFKANNSVDGIVLDLRGNGGGALFEATSLTDLFINYGPVVQIKDASGRIYKNNRAKRRAIYDKPLLVLIDRLSASASEIVAGALQDYRRAIVVGTQSYGKGTVQDISPVKLGQMKQTVSKFYRVSGESTQSRGVVPDISLPSIISIDEVGESQKDNALEWDTIARVPYYQKSGNTIDDTLDELRELSLDRRISDPNMMSLISKIALSRDLSAEKTLSLNLDLRKARSESWDEQVFVIENSRRTALNLEPFNTIDEWQAYLEDSEGEEESELPISETDPILFESARILADQIFLARNN